MNRQSGISLDRDGQFWHEGQLVRHEGLRRALFRWLDRLPPPVDRYILRLDAHRFAYIDVADTPLVVQALRWETQGAGAWVQLALSDGRCEPLQPATLTIDDDGILRCWVANGRLQARLATSAASTLGANIDETDGRFTLTIADQRHLIAAANQGQSPKQIAP